jgi:hypothetical protein
LPMKRRRFFPSFRTKFDQIDKSSPLYAIAPLSERPTWHFPLSSAKSRRSVTIT